jgi:hypothetical protein
MGCAGRDENCGAAMGCAGRSKRWRRGDGMRRPIEEMAAQQWDAPAKRIDGGGTANGMCRRNEEEMASRQWEVPAERGGKFVQSMEHHIRKEELGER